jgi:preprotein translocase subunit SecY
MHLAFSTHSPAGRCELDKGKQFVPGIRPGLQTAAYLRSIHVRLTLVGACYVCVICVPSEILVGRFELPNDFTGAAIVGMVTLILGIVRHASSLAVSVRYDGSTRRARVRR